MSLEQGKLAASAPGTLLITDARHPRHALYAAIAWQLPPGTLAETVANVVVQAVAHGITEPGRLSQLAVMGGVVYLRGQVPGQWALVDLRGPVLDLQTLSECLARSEAPTQEAADLPRCTR
jgi:hypothetical protein